MTERIRVGVVGTSAWANTILLPSIHSHAQAELVAICGRNRARAVRCAQHYHIPQIFTDYRAMLERAALHALVIATPDALHYPITLHALDAGLHVLCEKPLALNTQQARAMYEKAEAMGVRHMVFFTYRWMPHFRYMRRLIETGYLGRCYACDFKFLGGIGRNQASNWRFNRRHANGILADLGSHMIDLARWFIGEITQVSGHLAVFANHVDIDQAANDSAVLAMVFENGAHGNLQVSAMAHIADDACGQSVRLYGADGSLELDVIFAGAAAGATLRGARHDESYCRPLPVPEDLWGDIAHQPFGAAQMPDVFLKQAAGPRLFIDAICAGHTVAPTFYDGLKAQEVVDAALLSSQQRVWMQV